MIRRHVLWPTINSPAEDIEREGGYYDDGGMWQTYRMPVAKRIAKAVASVSSEQRKSNADRLAEVCARRTPEQRRAIAANANAALTREQRLANLAKARAALTPEQLRANSAKAHATITREQYLANIAKANAAITPEHRRAGVLTSRGILRSTNKSGYAGVCFNKRTSKWHAQICVAGKQQYLGTFDKIEDAIAARKAGELKYWKEDGK